MLADEKHVGGGKEGILRIIYIGTRMTAEEYYNKGKEFQRTGVWHEAIHCYLEAIAIDPDSPAVQAKQMVEDILNYYCRDMYNP